MTQSLLLLLLAFLCGGAGWGAAWLFDPKSVPGICLRLLWSMWHIGRESDKHIDSLMGALWPATAAWNPWWRR